VRERGAPALADLTSVQSAYYLDTNYCGAELTKVKSQELDPLNLLVEKMPQPAFKSYGNLNSPVKELIFVLSKLLLISPIKLIKFVTGVELLCTAKVYVLYLLRNIVACLANT
jgi:hypothetical protein